MTTTTTSRVYRVDKFKVPSAARDEFLARVHEIHEFLRTQPGFVEDALLEQTGGPGTFNIVTIAVWENADAVQMAREAAAARYAATGFNPGELMARLGIEADLANYAPIAA